MKEMRMVKVYEDKERFESECNKLLSKGFSMIPNSFNVSSQKNLNSSYYICLFQKE